MENSLKNIIAQQRKFFNQQHTKDISWRKQQLQKLSGLIQEHEDVILKALQLDLHKHRFEGYSSEVGVVQDEIKTTLKSLSKWSQSEKVNTPVPLIGTHSEIRKEPYGVCLVIAPWNYPFQLLMSPLVGAMAAGNCALVKPSEHASHTEKIIASLINDNFPEDYLYCATGGVDVSRELLAEKFDFIFFTGSTAVGKIVMRAAAGHLTPVCLELGGKSPCIVDLDVDIDLAAKRVTWGKFFNAGQTCIAPDYVYVHTAIKSRLLKRIAFYIRKFFGENASASKDLSHIINLAHFDRLIRLIDSQKVELGGGHDRESRFIEPTVICESSWNTPLMQAEIFGPLLPILEFEDLSSVIETVQAQPRPLALYVFSKNKAFQNRCLNEISFGGGCVNDCLLHFTNPHLPFGGVGNSGLGSYHGRHSFDLFSHHKGVLKNHFLMDQKYRYAPYSDLQLKLAKKIM